MSTEAVKNSNSDENGKNASNIYCPFCSSLIFEKGKATLIQHKFDLPHVHVKGEGEPIERETIEEYWLLSNLYMFENVSVSKCVEEKNYLACTDCEKGPVGYKIYSSKECYIAPSRVSYHPVSKEIHANNTCN